MHSIPRRSTVASAAPLAASGRPAQGPRRIVAGRRGAAVVELAVCLPILLLFVVGSIECCSMIYVDQSLAIASYEGVRTSIRYDATNAQVTQKCQNLLDARRVTGAVITLDPPNVSDAVRGTEVSITISAPCSGNSVLTPWFFGGRTLTETAKMIKE